MNLELVRSLIEQRAEFNRKMDEQIQDALGIPTDKAVKVSVSLGESEGIEDNQVFSSIPGQAPFPEKGAFYRLKREHNWTSFIVEIDGIDENDRTIRLFWNTRSGNHVFRLPLDVFMEMFSYEEDPI